MIEENEFIVVYNENVGAVWRPEYGELKKTTPEHAKAIEECLQKYSRHELSKEEEEKFESYIRKSFKENRRLVLKKCPNLLERKTISLLEIMIANDCNLNCKYCYADAGTYRKKTQRLSPEKALEYLQKLNESYDFIKKVMFFGGEPTLCPETIEAICEYFIQAVKDGKLKKIPVYTMVSNGTLINKRMADIIYKYNIIVTISVDGPEQINDLLRVDKFGKGTFEKVEEGIHQIENVGGKVALLEATYTKKHKDMGYSKNDIRKYLLQHFNVKDVVIGNCAETTKDLELYYDDPEEEEYDGSGKDILNRIYHKDFADIVCESGYGSAALMPDGELYPCHFFVEYLEYCIAKYENGFDFSNYENVLNKLEKAYHTKNENCKECWAKYTCTACTAVMLLNKDKGCKKIMKQQKMMILRCAQKH